EGSVAAVPAQLPLAQPVDEDDDGGSRLTVETEPACALVRLGVEDAAGTEAQRRGGNDVGQDRPGVVRRPQQGRAVLGPGGSLAHGRDRSRAWKTAARSLPAKSAMRSTAAWPSASAETRSMTSSAKIDPPYPWSPMQLGSPQVSGKASIRFDAPQDRVSETSTGLSPGRYEAGSAKVRPTMTVPSLSSSMSSLLVTARGFAPGSVFGSSSTCTSSSRVSVRTNAVTCRWMDSMSTWVSMWTKWASTGSSNRESASMPWVSWG